MNKVFKAFTPSDKPEPCKVCGEIKRRGAMLAHAHTKHPVQFDNWHLPRGAFGMSSIEHFYIRDTDKASIRT